MRAIVLGWCCALVSICWPTGPVLAQKQHVAQERPGALEWSGMVVDEAGEPLSGVRVAAYPESDPLGLGRAFLDGADPAFAADAVVARTARDGAYVLELPRPGFWALRFDGTSAAGPLAPATVVATAPILRSTVLRHVELHPVEPKVLRVVGPDGRPVAGARVETASFGYGGSFPRPADRFPLLRAARVRAITDEQGQVQCDTVGRMGHVLVFAPGHLPARIEWERDQPLDELRLERASQRLVRVERADGTPAAGAVAFVGNIAVGVVDGDGRVELPVPGNDAGVDLVVLGADNESIELPLTASRMERPLRLRPAVAVRVEVREAGPQGRPIEAAYVWEDWSAMARTDAEGRAQLPMTATPFSPHHWAPRRTGRAVYSFAPGHFGARRSAPDEPSTETLALALDPAASLPGLVVDEQGRPVRGAFVLAGATDLRGAQVRRQVLGGTADRSGDDGSFRFFHLDPSAELEIVAAARGYADASVIREAIEVRGSDPVELRLLRGILASGRVLDEAGLAIVGAVLHLGRTPEGGQDVQTLMRRRFQRSQPTFEAVSDETGEFEFVDLDAGTYGLKVEATGFAPTVVTGLQVERWDPDDDAATRGRPVFEIGTVVMIPGEELRGVVRTASGRAIEGATVSLQEPRNTIASLGRREDPAEFETDVDGRFVFDSLAVDLPYTIVARADGYAMVEMEGVRLPLEDGLELRLEPAVDVRGRVIGPEGQPIEQAFVLARGQAEGEDGAVPAQSFVSARGDEDGRFVLEDLARARWALSVRAPGHVAADDIEISVRPPETPADLTVRLEPGATLTGRVTGPDGEPVAGAQIQQRQTQSTGGMRFSMGGGRSEADGRFTVEGLPLGPASLSIRADGYLEAVRDLEVMAGENVLELQLERGWSISGLVVDAEGQPVAGAEMDAVQPRARRFAFGRGADNYSLADGSFEVPGLAPGVYEVTARKSGFAAGRTEEPVRIDGASVAGVRIELARGATVTGTITGLSFDELGRTSVYASEAGEAGMPLFTQPDYEGRYRLEGVPAGRWTLQAGVEDGKSRSETLELGPGETEAVVDFAFGTGVQLRGIVLRGEEPVPGASVRLLGLGSGSRASRDTDPAGGFVFDDVEPDRVELTVSVGRSGGVYEETIDLESSREIVVRLGAGRLAVRVVDETTDRPLAGARLSVQRDGNSGFRDWAALSTDEEGRVVLIDLEPGEQSLHVRRDGYGVETVAVTVVAGENPEVRVLLSRASGVWVTLLDANGRPLTRGTYTVLDGSGAPRILRGIEPDSGGTFLLEDLSPGRHDVAFADDRGAVARETVMVPEVGEAGTSLTVRLPRSGDARIEIPALRGSQRPLEIRILDPQGQAVVSPRQGEVWRSSGESTVLRALPLGTLTVQVRTRDGDESWSGQVTVREGAQSTLILD